MKTKKLRHTDGTVTRQAANDPASRRLLEKEANANLPGPGYQRDELLKLRKDKLNALLDKYSRQIAAGASVGSIAEKLGIENDIVKHFDPHTSHIRIKGERGDMVYAWICHDYPKDQKGLAVRKQLTIPGWEVVQGSSCTSECKNGRRATCGHEFPEAIDLLQPDGTRKIGDTILMRCDKIMWVKRELQLRAERHLRAKGLPGLKVPGRIHTALNDPVVKESFNRLGTSSGGMEEVLQEAPTDGSVAAEG